MDKTVLAEMLAENEGRYNHFYLDTAGNVTTGVGLLVSTVSEALALPFSPSECIAEDFSRVHRAQPGMSAVYYGPLCKSRMPWDAVDALTAKTIDQYLTGITAHFPWCDTWPDSVQYAVFDMVYNLGVVGMLKFHALNLALDRRDWERCAKECHRRGISNERNEKTAALFMAAKETS